MIPRPIVLAFGGNALLSDARYPGIQEKRAEEFTNALELLIPQEHSMVLVHGNGPQVGMILLRIEATKDRMPPETLDILVAETEGSMGYLLSRTLRNRFPNREVAAILTQVLVEPADPAFASPSKPVGPFYAKEEALALENKGWAMGEMPGKGWRRMVPSPRPKRVVEMHTIADAISHGHVVIAGGGGGIPVVERNGNIHGVEAVIDKDFTAALLAVALKAERLVILTDVPHVSTGFGQPSETPVGNMDIPAARRLLDHGEFPPASMGPKVEASIIFSEATGNPALITDVHHLASALKGKAGTYIGP